MADSTAQKLQKTGDELGDVPNVLLVPFALKNSIKLKIKNFIVEQTDNSSSNSFLLGHPVNGILGTATALGGSQVVLGSTTGSVTIELLRRSYIWDTTDELNKGIKSKNIDISQGFMQLGNITIKDIRLNHKENENF